MDFDYVAIIFSAVLALGGIQVLFSSFDDDDDDHNGGEGSPVFDGSLLGNPA